MHLHRLALVLAVSSALLLSACQEPQAPPSAASEPKITESIAAPAFTIDTSNLPPTAAFQATDLNPNISACQDLNAHVNGQWLAANPVPADRTTWGSFEMLAERSLAVQKQIAEQLAADSARAGVGKLIGDLYASGMNETAIDAAGLAPIQPSLDRIGALDSAAAIVGFLRAEVSEGRGLLYGIGAESDFKDPDLVIAYVVPGGLGLPDKTYYTGDTHKAVREAYQQHIAATLELAGASADDAKTQAAQVMAIEIELADKAYSSEELSRDVSKYYNPVSVADAEALAPAFGWAESFRAANVADPGTISLSNPEFFKFLSAQFEATPLAHWQAYLRFHTIDGAAPYLGKQWSDQNFAFYGRTLRGQQVQKDRFKRVLDTINGNVGEAMGELYVDVAFPAESKAQMQALVESLKAALKIRLEKLEWMSPETRAKALEKWGTFVSKIGYPDQWQDWTGLETTPESYVDNIRAAIKFNFVDQMGKVGKPKDRSEWGMTPQTVNAQYNPLSNDITFPAAILQPPFFDPNADAALNYGGIGAVIGHEMLHGYDDQGSRFNAKGSFANWWQPTDAEGFKKRTMELVEQFNAYEAAAGKNVNGLLTLGENIADLGGLTVSYDALKLAHGNDANTTIDGLTQDQRFFLNWATVWRRGYTDQELNVRLVTDSHAPAKFRANGAPKNMPAFAAAFNCQPSDPMVRAGDRRIAIW
jgi:putative endopeptidase